VPELTVTIGLAPNVTAAVPRFRSSPPANVKLPFQTCALLLSVSAEPELLPSVVAFAIVNAPVPSAALEFRFNLPASNVVPPL
jgi:hypothetical protein